MHRHILLFSASLLLAHSFTTQPRPALNLIALHASGRPRSRVSDPTGPTPTLEKDEIEKIAIEDIPEFHYDENNHPIPHQPWRRGETAGCEDPIDAEWRQKAEDIIRKAVQLTGGSLVDITWFLTKLVVTLEEDLSGIPKDYLKSSGPVINVRERESPMYRDPADPYPEDIWSDGDEVVYERDETEDDIKSKMYARKEEGEEDLEEEELEETSLYASQETREDDALRVAEEAALRAARQEKPINVESLTVDTAALSTVAGTILDALETVEDELKVLARHELILSSPGAPDVLETQSQFDAHRGHDVVVETEDPWESNRTLRGKLLDRNSMDVYINQKGRMVTIPLNFVKCVRLPHLKGGDMSRQSSENADLEDAEEEDFYE